MTASWSTMVERFASRTRRERLLIAALLVLGLPLVVLALWAEPAWRTHRTLQAEAHHLKTQTERSSPVARTDPNRIAREELARLQERIAVEQKALGERTRAIVRPAEMVALLEQFLARHPGVRLMGLQSLPAAAIGASGTKANGATEAGLYRHGVSLELEGSWPALRAYLGEIERSPRRLQWGDLQIQTHEHPTARMKLTVHTLSLEATWLQL